MIKKIETFLPFYLGCSTTVGRLVGVNDHLVFIKSEDDEIVQHDINLERLTIKLFLKKLRNLSEDESMQLIEKGFSVGRPKGYSFSPDAFLYALSLHVDLFNLIDSGLAIDMADKEM
jgi:hypothetical protein